MKRLILLILIVSLLGACSPDYQQVAMDKVKDYIISLDEQDIDKQLELLDQFDLNRDYYQANFLSFVESAEVTSITVAYEDDYIIIIRGEFSLQFKDDYHGSDRLQGGDNQVIRYFTFYKMEDMALKEILDKLIK